jgi:hypothetical protein
MVTRVELVNAMVLSTHLELLRAGCKTVQGELKSITTSSSPRAMLRAAWPKSASSYLRNRCRLQIF